jgi:2-polyprenyl-3-methyl-5-hydroxy-6-metoxy-1,4-benzoquinol methylase
MDLTEEQLRARVAELAPFHHAIELPHGVNTYVPDKAHRGSNPARVGSVKRHGWPQLLNACGGSLKGLRVLDVACNSGGFTVEAIKAGAAYALGVDIVDRYLEQAEFVRGVLGLENLEFRKLDVYDLTPEAVGRFDVVLCFGILYHLQDPIRGMKAMADLATNTMLLDTNLMHPPYISRFLRNRSLWKMDVVNTNQPIAETTNLWRSGTTCKFAPTERAVLEMLEFLGFATVEFLPPTEKGLEARYYKRERGTFLARR